jgi:hypothetical protein
MLMRTDFSNCKYSSTFPSRNAGSPMKIITKKKTHFEFQMCLEENGDNCM